MKFEKTTLKTISSACCALASSDHPAAWECLAHIASLTHRVLNDEWGGFEPVRRRFEIRTLVNRLSTLEPELAARLNGANQRDVIQQVTHALNREEERNTSNRNF